MDQRIRIALDYITSNPAALSQARQELEAVRQKLTEVEAQASATQRRSDALGSELTQTAAAADTAAAQIDDLTEALDEAAVATTDAEAAQESQGDTLLALGRRAGVAAAGYLSLKTAVTQANAAIETYERARAVERSLYFSTGGDALATAADIAFLEAETERLGFRTLDLAPRYARLAAAMRMTGFEAAEIQQLFLGAAEAAAVLGLNSEQLNGMLVAFEQIASKGTVSAEEISGQLGERLPGAFAIAARSLNVTTQALQDLLRRGEITAQQMLPALGRELRATFGPDAERAAFTSTRQLDRFLSKVDELRTLLGEPLDRELASFIQDLTEQLERLAQLLDTPAAVPPADPFAGAGRIPNRPGPGGLGFAPLDPSEFFVNPPITADAYAEQASMQRALAEAAEIERRRAERSAAVRAKMDEISLRYEQERAALAFSRLSIAEQIAQLQQQQDAALTRTAQAAATGTVQEVEAAYTLVQELDLQLAALEARQADALARLATFDRPELVIAADGSRSGATGFLDEITRKARLAQTAAAGIGDGFAEAMFSGQDAGTILIGVLQQLVAQLVSATIQALLLNTVLAPFTAGGSLAGGGLGSIFSGILGFASGGNPPVGVPSLFGERGPELAVPQSAHVVLPAEITARLLGGPTVQNQFTFLRDDGTPASRRRAIAAARGQVVRYQD